MYGKFMSDMDIRVLNIRKKRGLSQLKAAGIQAILDHHALPGVQTANQMFTGNCTSNVQFYTDYNYHRALVWTAVMTALSHLDSDFDTVFAIEAVNGQSGESMSAQAIN